MQSKGSALVLAVLASAAFVSSSVNCAIADDISTVYIDLPSNESQSRNALYEILSQEKHLAGLEPQKMLAEFAELGKSGASALERHFFNEMHKMGEQGEAACNSNMRGYVLEIISLAKQYPESAILANYMNFLRTIGKAKLAECAAQTKRDFDIRLSLGQGNMRNLYAFKSAEDHLDAFYGAYANSKKKLYDEELYELAKRVNFSKDEFGDVRKMFKVANGYSDIEDEYEERLVANGKIGRAINIISQFVVDACTEIEFGIKEVLEQYSVAEALGAQPPSDDVPMRFLKLREYVRNSLPFDRNDKDVRENIARQLDAKRGKWYKFGKKLI